MDQSDRDSNDSLMSTESEKNDEYLQGLDSDSDPDYDPKGFSESDEEQPEQPKEKRLNQILDDINSDGSQASRTSSDYRFIAEHGGSPKKTLGQILKTLLSL